VLSVVALLIVALVVFVIVKVARRNKGDGNGPGSPGAVRTARESTAGAKNQAFVRYPESPP
jgi:large-conductance mechanosensitive channel